MCVCIIPIFNSNHFVTWNQTWKDWNNNNTIYGNFKVNILPLHGQMIYQEFTKTCGNTNSTKIYIFWVVFKHPLTIWTQIVMTITYLNSWNRNWVRILRMMWKWISDFSIFSWFQIQINNYKHVTVYTSFTLINNIVWICAFFKNFYCV